MPQINSFFSRSCNPKTSDICVRGICQPAGCDHKLGSNTKKNKCGVCGGSRKSCKKVKGKCVCVRGYGIKFEKAIRVHKLLRELERSLYVFV